MSNLYVERIDNAIRVLRDVPDDDFQMHSWRSCALGHCMNDAWFNDQGFDVMNKSGAVPAFDGELGFDAAAKFFGIPVDVSQHLFVGTSAAYQTSNPGRREVIAQFEVMRMKKLAEIETGGLIEVKDFEAARLEEVLS